MVWTAWQAQQLTAPQPVTAHMGIEHLLPFLFYQHVGKPDWRLSKPPAIGTNNDDGSLSVSMAGRRRSGRRLTTDGSARGHRLPGWPTDKSLAQMLGLVESRIL